MIVSVNYDNQARQSGLISVPKPSNSPSVVIEHDECPQIQNLHMRRNVNEKWLGALVVVHILFERKITLSM